MLKTLENLFSIKRIIENSPTPLTTKEICLQSNLSLRMIQRYAMCLALEDIVSFKPNPDSGYLYFKKA